MSNSPVTAIIVGAGHRAFIYANLAVTQQDKLKIVGVADPNPIRRRKAMELFGFGEDMCFPDAQTLAAHGKLSDAIINGTMDHQHMETAVPLLDAGYDMLLEKPFATNEVEMRGIVDAARRNNSKVMICHVLRYTPFYSAIKERLLNGEIGEIINIQTNEHVSFDHLSSSYVRGKWANSKRCGTSMLLAKCCHDIDLIAWMMGGEVEPEWVSSTGSRFQFREENAPAGSGSICMKDCPLVDSCVYSTKKLYVDNPTGKWGFYVWDALEDKDAPTREDKVALMKSDSPYARCIYKCDNDIVDHQSVLIRFKNGATATHNMVGGSAEPRRFIHIVGTKGEIFGNFEESSFTVLKIDPSVKEGAYEYTREKVDLNVSGDMVGAYGGHGGGDERLAEDFVSFVRGENPSISCTSIFGSVTGHLCVYLADRSMKNSGKPEEYEA